MEMNQSTVVEDLTCGCWVAVKTAEFGDKRYSAIGKRKVPSSLKGA